VATEAGGAAGGGQGGQAPGWVPYQPGATIVAFDYDRRLGLLGLRSFRILLWFGIAAVVSLVARNALIRGSIPWADVATAAALSLALWLVGRRPSWLKPLSWIVLAALLLDVLDGVWPLRPRAVTGTHILMPMLVLYGALLCDIAITAVATAAVLGLCAFTWVGHAPLSLDDELMLYNVVLATMTSGIVGLVIWMHHRRLMGELGQQAEELRLELETNNRLTAVIFHDIANPLAALVGTLDLAKVSGSVGTGDVTLMDRMAGRIAAIIDNVRAVNAGRLGEVPRELVTADRMESELREVFAAPLAAKEQRFSLTAGSGLAVSTVPGVLLNSVLGNLLSNAIKFSPQGSSLELRAAREGETVRVEIRDQGGGFPADFLARDAKRVTSSRPGTRGEKGHGHGLNIAALHAAKLGGRLEIMNRGDGGAAVAVVLPA
jgi:signal transduction histidine kinase